MLPYDAVLFDVDGTLLDSAPGILSTLREVFHTMGTDIAGGGPDALYRAPSAGHLCRVSTPYEARIEQATELYRASYAVRGCHICKPYPGAAAMLRRLRAAGLTICTATCKPPRW